MILYTVRNNFLFAIVKVEIKGHIVQLRRVQAPHVYLSKLDMTVSLFHNN